MRRGIYHVIRGSYSKDLELNSWVKGFDGIVFTMCECGDPLCEEEGMLYLGCGCKTKPGHIRRALDTMCEACMLKNRR